MINFVNLVIFLKKVKVVLYLLIIHKFNYLIVDFWILIST